MTFSRAQKKFLKKHHSYMSVAELARSVSAPEPDVAAYIKTRWREKPVLAQKGPHVNSPSWDMTSVFALRSTPVAYIILTLLVFLAFVNSVNNAFVSDDIRYLVNNPAIHSFRFVTVTPLTMVKALSNFLTYTIFGMNPWAFHLVNIAFHTLAVWSFYALLTGLVNKRTAFLAAAVVAVHPIFTESVTWIGGGGYVMYGAFFLISLLLYVKSDGRPLRYLSAGFFFFAMLLTSEKSIPLGVCFPLFEFCRGSLQKNWKRTLPFVILSAIWFILFFGVFRYAQQRLNILESDFSVTGFYNPLVQIPVALSSYLTLIFWPQTLSFFHSQLAFPLPEFIVRLSVTVLFFTALAVAFIRNRMVLFFLLLVPVSLSPSLTPFAVAWVVAERYAYLTGIGIIAAVGIVLDRLISGMKYQRVVLVTGFVVIGVLLIRTVLRNIDWTNEDTLWLATYETAPMDPRVHNNVGEYYLRRKQYPQAEEEFKKAIGLTVTRPIPYYNLGLLYFQTDQPDTAVMYLRRAIEKNHDFTDAWRLLASIFYEQQKYPEAREALETLRKLEPQNSLVFTNLGFVYEKSGDMEKAVEALRQAIRLDSENVRARKELEKLTAPHQ